VQQLISGQPQPRQLSQAYEAQLAQLAHSFGGTAPGYLQWLALAHACTLNPGSCTTGLQDLAYSSAARAQSSYQLATAAYEHRTDTGGATSLPIAIVLALAAAAAPEILGLAGPEAATAGGDAAPEEAAAGAGGARIPFGPGTEKAWSVLDRALGKGSPFPGFKGGSIFKNLEGQLPALDSGGNPMNYTEWDVNPFIKGVNRGPERVVIGGDGSAYYTGDHYETFLQFWGP